VNLRKIIEEQIALKLPSSHALFDETCSVFEKAIEAKLAIVAEKEMKKIDDRRVFALAKKLSPKRNDE
jgi:hypothetical protein